MLEIAVDRDPTLRDRHGELGLRKLLRDTEVIIDRVALTIASNDASFCREWAELVAPVYRRRRVPMDDIVHLFEALRLAAASVLSPTERMAADEGIDGAIAVLRWHRRIAGDARKRNPILQFLYKGA